MDSRLKCDSLDWVRGAHAETFYANAKVGQNGYPFFFGDSDGEREREDGHGRGDAFGERGDDDRFYFTNMRFLSPCP